MNWFEEYPKKIIKTVDFLYYLYYIDKSNSYYFLERNSMAVKYSKQREEIKAYLSTRKDHPTADQVYTAMRTKIPNISLGTVYRNLNLLADTGEILRLQVGDKTDHFDYDTSPHHHFVCKKCGAVIDLAMPSIDSVMETATLGFNGTIKGYDIYFYGTCEACRE